MPDLSPFISSGDPEAAREVLREVRQHISWQEAKSALGNYVIKFQLLETTIKDSVALLIRGDPLSAQIATSAMSFRKMLEVLNALFVRHITDQDKRSLLRRILGECANFSNRRNDLVHSYWSADEEGVVVRFKIQTSRTKPHREDKEPIFGEILEAEARLCETVRGHLVSLMKETSILPLNYS